MSTPNPYAPPKSDVSDIATEANSADINALSTSPAWKVKFSIIAKAGGPKLPRLKELPFGERMKIGFNVLAFLFGPIYYLVKGMWRKGLALFVVCILVIIPVAVVLELIGLGRFANALGYGAAAVFAIRANIDFYKKMVLKENGWW